MKKPVQTRNYIIEVAAPIFNRYGYAATSLSDILEQTALTKGAIYHHFENKDDLALAALEYNLKLAMDLNFRSARNEINTCDKLIEFSGSFKTNYQLVKQIGGCPVLNAAVDSDDGNELIRDRIINFIRVWKKSIINIIENGKLNSEIRPDTDAEKFAMNFISLIEGGLAMSKISGESRYIDNSVALIQALIEDMRQG